MEPGSPPKPVSANKRISINGGWEINLCVSTYDGRERGEGREAREGQERKDIESGEGKIPSQAQPCVSVILTLRRLRQEGHREFKASLGCTTLTLSKKKKRALWIFQAVILSPQTPDCRPPKSRTTGAGLD